MFNGDDLFYVIPVGLSHLSLELVDFILMVLIFLSFIHPSSPLNHLFYVFFYPPEVVLMAVF